MFNSSLPDDLSKTFVGVVIVPGGEGRGHIALNTAAIFHVHFQVVQSWKNWLKYFE